MMTTLQAYFLVTLPYCSIIVSLGQGVVTALMYKFNRNCRYMCLCFSQHTSCICRITVSMEERIEQDGSCSS